MKDLIRRPQSRSTAFEEKERGGRSSQDSLSQAVAQMQHSVGNQATLNYMRSLRTSQSHPPAPPSSEGGIAASGSGKVIQGLFTFSVDTDNYTVTDSKYFRIQGNKFMTGNKQEKHVTADSLKDNMWTGMDGLGLVAFSKKLMGMADRYQSLPGVDLVNAHKLDEEEVDSEDEGTTTAPSTSTSGGVNQPMRENFAEFETVWDSLGYLSSQLHSVVEAFQRAGSKMEQDAAAFHIQNRALKLIENLEKFSDLMPLVNVVSTLQKGGYEREAKSFLATGKATKNVKDENQALWAFFDFAAISELSGGDIDNNLAYIRSSLPWLDTDKLAEAVASNRGVDVGALTASDYTNALAGIMIANHIELVKMSYPDAAARVNFGNQQNVLDALNTHDTPVDRSVVVAYAIGGWDYYK